MNNSRPTPERLKELLDYCSDCGEFFWKQRRGGTAHKGTKAGAHDAAGYIQITVDLRNYRAHVLAWVYMTGEWPSQMIDHRDGVKDNNSFSNLREVSRTVNAQNKRLPAQGNSSGYLGVSKCKSGWLAQMKVNKKHVLSKVFDTPEEAHEAYLKAKRELHEGCTI